ncbi:flagellar basal body rod protein FlgB [Jeotgalibacillus sp. S-D1]|uniref:flagellar basal body rod protein FlgB n=1 Tax=Jeotgalibacillus sp. S-D1 TaxID=2552189 RepID=UPI00105A82AB|nr:flagellar basal body rod protein FlgB [Jeotgalibacillus sp. S-D1]TDL35048.1 flagellar basal body rod protein FlgB [Jeotgalibacillus sp. S-D1]
MNLFSGSISQLEQGLHYSSVKQKVISNNIANIDTPNYKSKDVDFNEILQSEMKMSSSSIKVSDPRHFPISASQNSSTITSKMYSVRENGNGVDMDREMAELATNQIYYDALVERISGKFGSLNSVIRGGK